MGGETSLPWWLWPSLGVPVVGIGVLLYRWVARDELSRVGQAGALGARARSVLAAGFFATAIGAAGYGSWLLATRSPRELLFALSWTAVALYFLVAAGTFKTQMGRFGAGPRATAQHLLQAALWGPIMVLMLWPRSTKQVGPEEP